jgi:hypothetical protein
MSDNQTEHSGQKIIGIPVENIAKLSYILILASTGFTLLLTFLGILGMGLPGTAFFGGIGLFAVFLSLVSLFVFEERFTALDKSHFKFIALAYVTFFVALIVVGTILSIFGSFGYLIIFLVAAAQFLTFYTGFRLHKGGELADKDNLNREYQNYKGLVLNKFKKAEEKAAETVKHAAETVEEKVDEVSDKVDAKLDDDDDQKPGSVDKSA